MGGGGTSMRAEIAAVADDSATGMRARTDQTRRRSDAASDGTDVAGALLLLVPTPTTAGTAQAGGGLANKGATSQCEGGNNETERKK